MTAEERVEALRPFGFTARQTRFLAFVMTHSGVCLQRQYAAFAGIVHGEKTRRFFAKLVQLGLVSSAGRRWLGIAGTGALTPLAGPLLTSGTALDFRYYDDQGAVTATPSEVKSIVFRLYGETDRLATRNIAGTPALLQDSMIVRVQLRNGR